VTTLTTATTLPNPKKKKIASLWFLPNSLPFFCHGDLLIFICVACACFSLNFTLMFGFLFFS